MASMEAVDGSRRESSMGHILFWVQVLVMSSMEKLEISLHLSFLRCASPHICDCHTILMIRGDVWM